MATTSTETVIGTRRLRTETELIDITQGPQLGGYDDDGNYVEGHPGDIMRRTMPGMTRYFIDDEEVDFETVVAAIAEATGTDITPTDPPDHAAEIAAMVADHEPEAE